MSKPKFKVGDIVEILDGSEIKNYYGGWVRPMNQYVGKTTKIRKHHNDSPIGYYLEDIYDLVWDERGLKPVKPKNESIVIYRKNNKVVALNKATGKTAIARCNPIDTFDFDTGAKLAFERLMGTDKPVKQNERKPYNGKVVCISTPPILSYTVGKIYEFKNGRTKQNNGRDFPICPVFSFEEFENISGAKFIEIVE